MQPSESEVCEAFFEERPKRVDPKSVPVRFSNLKEMSRSPAHYRSAIEDDREETLAMRLGSGVHAMLLGRPWTVFTGKVRSGKKWDEFEDGHPGCVILNQRERDEAKRIVDAVMGHSEAAALLQGAELEHVIDWTHELQGRACRGTPDAFTDARVVELKTTRCSDPERFVRDARWRHYHAQLAWYLDAVSRSGLGTPSEAYIIAVESSRPHPVTVLRLTEKAIDEGRRLCRVWMERLIVSETFDRWPSYCEAIVPFDVEDSGELTLRIGGEDFEV